MTKRALLIGSQTQGLTGVHNDIELIGPRLEQRGFVLDVRKEGDASRAGILAGLERLIADSQPGDPALIYYSGHGARVCNPRHGPGQGREPALLHSLVPTDWSLTSFQGLLDLELSLRLAALTAKTRNVALILDCCHAARTWKGADSDAVPRALDRVAIDGLDSQLQQLRSRDLSRLHGESNPDAVRLVAAEADRSAFEMTLDVSGQRQRVGLLTAKLAEVLDELGDARVCWRTLGLLVRERVMQCYDFQRPELEGPGQRYLFELSTASYGGCVPYFRDRNDRPALRASRLLGAEPGARYAIMPAGVSEYDAARAVATATVTKLVGTAAQVELELTDPEVAPGVGALAFPLETTLGEQLVRIEGPAAGPLRELVAASAHVGVAGEHDAAMMRVEVGEHLTLFTDADAALSIPEQNDASGRARVLEDLERWARAETVRNLANGRLRARARVTWGRVVDDERVRMSEGEPLHVDDRIYVEFENQSEAQLYFTAFDIGIDGAVTLLTTAEPSGTKVEPGSSYILGQSLGSGGLRVAWPRCTPQDAALPGSLLVIVSEGRHDFLAFEVSGRRSRAAQRKAPATALERILDQIGTGARRNMVNEGPVESGDYLVERHDFSTEPQPRVAGQVTATARAR